MGTEEAREHCFSPGGYGGNEMREEEYPWKASDKHDQNTENDQTPRCE